MRNLKSRNRGLSRCSLGCTAAWAKRPGLTLLRSSKARTLRLQRLTPVSPLVLENSQPTRRGTISPFRVSDVSLEPKGAKLGVASKVSRFVLEIRPVPLSFPSAESTDFEVNTFRVASKVSRFYRSVLSTFPALQPSPIVSKSAVLRRSLQDTIVRQRVHIYSQHKLSFRLSWLRFD